MPQTNNNINVIQISQTKHKKDIYEKDTIEIQCKAWYCVNLNEKISVEVR